MDVIDTIIFSCDLLNEKLGHTYDINIFQLKYSQYGLFGDNSRIHVRKRIAIKV